MSRLIALEASSENCSVAVLDGANCYAQLSDKPRSHASALLPMLDDLLMESGISLSSVDAITLTHGPGSFTGIRIAMSVAQGLAYGAGLPVVPVSTLELLAYQATQKENFPARRKQSESRPSCYFVPMIDARMNEIYWATYRMDGNSLCEVSKPAVSSADHINIELSRLEAAAGLVGVGNGWLLGEVNCDVLVDRDENLSPNARDLAHFGKKMMLEGRIQNIEDVQPLYLRNEVSWNKRTRVRNN